jgi:hypothetical protein
LTFLSFFVSRSYGRATGDPHLHPGEHGEPVRSLPLRIREPDRLRPHLQYGRMQRGRADGRMSARTGFPLAAAGRIASITVRLDPLRPLLVLLLLFDSSLIRSSWHLPPRPPAVCLFEQVHGPSHPPTTRSEFIHLLLLDSGVALVLEYSDGLPFGWLVFPSLIRRTSSIGRLSTTVGVPARRMMAGSMMTERKGGGEALHFPTIGSRPIGQVGTGRGPELHKAPPKRPL